MTIQKIESILKDSLVNIYKDNKSDLFIFNIIYKNQNQKDIETSSSEIDELRNKILLSSTNSNALKKEGEIIEKKISKEIITNQFVNLFDNIRQLLKTLNSLKISGYPSISEISLKIIDSKAYDENDIKKDLEQIINQYKEKTLFFPYLYFHYILIKYLLLVNFLLKIFHMQLIPMQ